MSKANCKTEYSQAFRQLTHLIILEIHIYGNDKTIRIPAGYSFCGKFRVEQFRSELTECLQRRAHGNSHIAFVTQDCGNQPIP